MVVALTQPLRLRAPARRATRRAAACPSGAAATGCCPPMKLTCCRARRRHVDARGGAPIAPSLAVAPPTLCSHCHDQLRLQGWGRATSSRGQHTARRCGGALVCSARLQRARARTRKTRACCPRLRLLQDPSSQRVSLRLLYTTSCHALFVQLLRCCAHKLQTRQLKERNGLTNSGSGVSGVCISR